MTATGTFAAWASATALAAALRNRASTFLPSVRGGGSTCAVRLAENELTDEAIGKLQTELDSFLQTPLSYLFYKDRETFERFCKEISINGGR